MSTCWTPFHKDRGGALNPCLRSDSGLIGVQPGPVKGTRWETTSHDTQGLLPRKPLRTPCLGDRSRVSSWSTISAPRSDSRHFVKSQ